MAQGLNRHPYQQIQIFNMQGQLVDQITFSENQFNFQLSGLKPGQYFIKIIDTNDGISNTKLTVL